MALLAHIYGLSYSRPDGVSRDDPLYKQALLFVAARNISSLDSRKIPSEESRRTSAHRPTELRTSTKPSEQSSLQPDRIVLPELPLFRNASLSWRI
jgi:hypothetical protein